MKIRYTLHALERIHQRGIAKELVEECIRNPDRDEKLEYAHRCIKKLNDMVLIVIYRKDNDSIMILTAFKSTKSINIYRIAAFTY
ncbi:MAG: hypothetical protein B7O98_00255 [Zestosphaera tikiterensis]|uniref:DUF4258 domain-containing protein n=1 Tax=Zestosphaera tikiterensis TaxID=1973259 RepID=A0A2R7Y8L3_9CREN|nr:MAG: hypothetical protein B7O98_00255 [Zestosphaera tikiterensis]